MQCYRIFFRTIIENYSIFCIFFVVFKLSNYPNDSYFNVLDFCWWFPLILILPLRSVNTAFLVFLYSANGLRTHLPGDVMLTEIA